MGNGPKGLPAGRCAAKTSGIEGTEKRKGGFSFVHFHSCGFRRAAAGWQPLDPLAALSSRYALPLLWGMQLSTTQYDQLERAIVDGTRLTIMRRGTEYIVIPERLRVANGREIIVARHPSTGHRLELVLDEIDALEVVR